MAQDDGGYILPDPLDPDESICVLVRVPNAQGHRIAFVGALEELAHWYTWQRDPAHQAITAAAIWRSILANVKAQLDAGGTDCNEVYMDVRQNPANPCILEKSLNGLDWLPFADLRLCSALDVLERYDPETLEKEVSFDGGETWEDGDPYDPRFTGPRLDAITGSCEEVNSIVRQVQEVLTQTLDNIALGLAATAVAAAVVGLISVVVTAGATIPVALAMITTLAALTPAAVNAALTNDVWEEFRCVVLSVIGGATEITTAHYDQVLAGLGAIGDVTAETAIRVALGQMGPVGMQNAATLGMLASGIPEACDCDDCGQSLDLAAGQSITELITGEYVAGLGYRSLVITDQWGTYKRVHFAINCSEDTLITTIEVHVASGYNSGGNGSMFATAYLDGNLVWSSGGYFIPNGAAPLTAVFSNPNGMTVDRVEIRQWAVHSQVATHTVIDGIYVH